MQKFETADLEMARILREKTEGERLAIAFGMWRFARDMLRSVIRADHPDWSEEEVQREAARRLACGNR